MIKMKREQLQRNASLVKLLVLFSAALLFSCAERHSFIEFETNTFTYRIDRMGNNAGFADRDSGTDYLDSKKESKCAILFSGGEPHTLSTASYADGILELTFDTAGVVALVEVTKEKNYLVFNVNSIEGDNVDRLVFVNIPLAIDIEPDSPFAACSLALTENTQVIQRPALQKNLQASCYARFGMEGTKTAVLGVPRDTVLETIREIMKNESEFPYIENAGAWAQDTPFCHGSYLFNFGTLTEETADDWIATVQSLGFNQIDNHGGGGNFFRFGDFHLNEQKWPEGWDTYKRIVDKLHNAGISSIFHTYAFFIDKQSKYVTPVPHPGLGAFRSFTLSEDIAPDTAIIPVIESTADISTITGFFERNSVTLHIDDELILFSGITQQPPYRFTGCERGAYGTKAAAHKKNSSARHLKECFGLFCPDPESELFEEIAKNHADIINFCGFDGIYLDAIDGSDILGGRENAWYYGQKFVFDIYKYLDRPVSMEMSAMWHQMWHFRSRWQAWDYPNRGQKRFIDIHADRVDGGLLLPLHLGWWNFQTFNPPQVEPSYPDVIEYLGCKMIGYNAGLSMTGAVNKDNLRDIPALRKLVGIVKQYEDLRHADYFDESTKRRLREPGKEFTLFRDENNAWRFKPVVYDKHRVEGIGHPTSSWQVVNTFENQPVKLRIEALMSGGPYDAPGNIVLADYSDKTVLYEPISEDGVEATMTPYEDDFITGYSSGMFGAVNKADTPRYASWIRIDRQYTTPLDLSGHQALGVWVHGDGNGEILNFRLESPKHIAHGSIADHYITVDFRGWRYFELIETESSRWSDYIWKDGKSMYNVYRELVNYKYINSFSLWMNNLPAGEKVSCHVSPVKALPMVSNKIVNPAVSVGGAEIVFPVEMMSGDYLEFYSTGDCTLYDSKGAIRAKVVPKGAIPEFRSGINECTFSCKSNNGLNPRLNVTVISYGTPL